MPPLYDWRCHSCGIKFEEYASMNDMDGKCPECGGDAKRLVSCKIHLHTDYASKDFVTSDITGSEVRITSRKQMRELCARNGVVPKEGPPANRTKYKREEAADSAKRRASKKKLMYV